MASHAPSLRTAAPAYAQEVFALPALPTAKLVLPTASAAQAYAQEVYAALPALQITSPAPRTPSAAHQTAETAT